MKRHVTLLLAAADLQSAVSLVLGLQDAGFRTLYAPDGHWALRLARAAAPDLVLLDARLPRMDGFAVCRALRQGAGQARRWESAVSILLLVTRREEQVRALELGADGCLVEPVGLRELLARVRATLRRRALDGGYGSLAGDRIARGDIVLDRATRQAWRAGRPIRLRRREFDLLWVLVENAGRAIPRQELLARVWGEDWVGNPRTLDVHIRWLREKLEEDPSAPRYIQTLRGYGHRFAGIGD